MDWNPVTRMTVNHKFERTATQAIAVIIIIPVLCIGSLLQISAFYI